MSRPWEEESSERFFRELAENIEGIFYLHSADGGDILYASPSYEKVFGRSRAGLFENHRDWIEAIHPDDQERVGRAYEKYMREGDFDEEYRIVRPDGTQRWIRDRGVRITDEHGHTYRLAGIAEDITDRKVLERLVLSVGDDERQRISRDLHDSVGQELTGLGYLARSLRQKLAQRAAPEAEQADLMIEAIGRSVQAVRDAIRGLTPIADDPEGLRAALRDLANTTGEQSGLECSFACPSDVAVDDRSVADHLYRIAQEAVTNALKHSRAKRIAIRLANTDGALVLEIRDDGIGLPKMRDDDHGVGHEIMRFRANVIGGRLEISSQPRRGVSVSCRVNTG